MSTIGLLVLFKPLRNSFRHDLLKHSSVLQAILLPERIAVLGNHKQSLPECKCLTSQLVLQYECGVRACIA